MSLLLATLAAAAAPGLCTPVRIDTVRLNGIVVRQVPTANAKIVGRLLKGTIAHVCQEQGGWAETRLDTCLNRGTAPLAASDLAACPVGWFRIAKSVPAGE